VLTAPPLAGIVERGARVRQASGELVLDSAGRGRRLYVRSSSRHCVNYLQRHTLLYIGPRRSDSRTVPSRAGAGVGLSGFGSPPATRERLIGGRYVLTSAHVVVGAAEVVVRRPDKSEMRADLATALIGDPDPRKLDLAILKVPGAEELPYVPVALVDRNSAIAAFIDGCAAVGYPEFQEVMRDLNGVSLRETAQVRGYIAPLSGLVEGLLSLEVTAYPERELPPAGTTLAGSVWAGMSGAAVFAPGSQGGEVVLGVVTEPAPRRGQSSITVLPLHRLVAAGSAPLNASEWWDRLGVKDPLQIPRYAVRGNPRQDEVLAVLRSLLEKLEYTRLFEIDPDQEIWEFGFETLGALALLCASAIVAVRGSSFVTSEVRTSVSQLSDHVKRLRAFQDNWRLFRNDKGGDWLSIQRNWPDITRATKALQAAQPIAAHCKSTLSSFLDSA
jgi:hypothetical protein